MFTNIIHYKAICIFSVLFLILAIGNSTNASQNTIEKYGQSKGEPIDGGFFFYDNEYIEAPYVVKRIGLEIYINEHKVDFITEPYDWRIFDDPGNPPSDLKLPTCIPHQNTEYYDKYWGLKYRYLRANKTEEQANKDFTDLMKNMPGVSKIETDPDNSKRLIITYDSGQSQFYNWIPERVTGLEFADVPDKEELIQRAEESRLFYEQRFKNNNGFFDRSNGGNMIMGASAALRIIDVLIEHESSGDRMKALEGKGSPRLLMDPWKSQLESIQTTPQLAQRAERIRKEIEDERNAKNAISIARGTEDWVSNPENVLGDPDLPLNIQDSSVNSTSDSNDKAIKAKTILRDKTNSNNSLADNKNNNQVKIILFSTILLIIPLCVAIIFGFKTFLIVRKKGIMKISRKYTIGITTFIFILFICCVYMIRVYDAESRRKEGEAIIRERFSNYNGILSDPYTLTDEYFATITDLRLGYDEPFDLSFLEKLTNLEQLSIEDYAMTRGPASKPAIPKWKLICAKLHILDLENTECFDLRPIGKLSNLQKLFLIGSKISDIEPLENLKNLERLDMTETRVSNIEPLKNLKNLQHLCIVNSHISNFEPVMELKNLEEIYIYDNVTSEQIDEFHKAFPDAEIQIKGNQRKFN